MLKFNKNLDKHVDQLEMVKLRVLNKIMKKILIFLIH